MTPARIALASLIVAALSAPVLAQPGPGKGGPRYRFTQDNVPGWSLMSAAERNAHRDKMLALKTYEECKAYLAEHRKTMEERAKEEGKALRAPRYDACEQMKSRGLIK